MTHKEFETEKENIVELLQKFLDQYIDFNIDLEYESIKDDEIITYISNLYCEKEEYKDSTKKVNSELQDLYDDYSSLELQYNELEESELYFREIDGNDRLKANILKKAFDKYSVSELESRLELDYLDT